MEVAAADDGREVEVAERWIVYGVADDVFCGGLVEDGAVDGGNVSGGYDEEVPGEIAFCVLALVPCEFA